MWGRLLYQSYITLNILHTTRINPTLSAYNMIWGAFYFNRTPIRPPGCKIIVHEKPGKRRAWAFNGVPGFYIGPFINGYRTYKFYTPKTRAEKSAETVYFSTINQNVLHVNKRRHHKGSHQYMNFP